MDLPRIRMGRKEEEDSKDSNEMMITCYQMITNRKMPVCRYKDPCVRVRVHACGQARADLGLFLGLDHRESMQMAPHSCGGLWMTIRELRLQLKGRNLFN